MKQQRPISSVTSAQPPRWDPIQPPDPPQAVSANRHEEKPDPPLAEGAHDERDADSRHRMISEAAYRLYEKRGFAEGHAIDDWLEAEAAIDAARHQKT